MGRAKHLVASKNPRLALLALDIIGQGCLDLVDQHSEFITTLFCMFMFTLLLPAGRFP
jgi:hypothetical protein